MDPLSEGQPSVARWQAPYPDRRRHDLYGRENVRRWRSCAVNHRSNRSDKRPPDANNVGRSAQDVVAKGKTNPTHIKRDKTAGSVNPYFHSSFASERQN